MKVSAIVPSAGVGKRIGGKKQFMEIGGEPILARTLKNLAFSPLITEIIIVTASEDILRCEDEIVKGFAIQKVSHVVAGGESRQDSVRNGVEVISQVDIILVHDGARPFVTDDMIVSVVDAATKHGAATVAVGVKDTVKKVEGGFIDGGVSRDGLYRIQTPQAFVADVLRKGVETAHSDNFQGTDESSLVERLGKKVAIVEGSETNIKITTKEDLKIAEAILTIL